MYFSGWSLNSDPDYQLGINTCANLPTETDGTGGTTQDGYCDPKFDELYTAAAHRTRPGSARQEIVEEMLAMNYESSVQVSLWYGNSLEAYRSDRFENFTLQPADGGIITNQAGYWGYLTVEPVGEGSGMTAVEPRPVCSSQAARQQFSLSAVSSSGWSVARTQPT